MAPDEPKQMLNVWIRLVIEGYGQYRYHRYHETGVTDDTNYLLEHKSSFQIVGG